MSRSRAMTASNLKSIRDVFDNGISYHFTEPTKLAELTKLVDKYNRVLDYGLPTSGTAFLRLNTTVKRSPNTEHWALSGGAMTHESVAEEVQNSINVVLAANPGFEVADQQVTAWILNEWDRWSVVFELVITLKVKA